MINKNILILVGIIYCISWVLQLGAILFTENIASDAAQTWLVITMFVPTVVTCFFLVKFKELRSRVMWKPNFHIIKATLVAILVPTLIAFTVILILLFLDYGRPGWFEFLKTGVVIKGGPWVLGLGNNSWVFFAVNILATAVVFSLINAVPAAGEEFVWRGFLQGILVEKLGVSRGIIVLGLIWSFWHLPALLAGYNHPQYPVVGSFIFQPLQEISVSFFLAWLTISCKSFLPAAIAHGAGNSIQEGLINNITLSVSKLHEDIIVILVTVIIGLSFWFLLRKKDLNQRVLPK